MNIQEDTGVPHWLSRRSSDDHPFSHPTAEFPRPPGYPELSRPFRPQAATVFCCGPSGLLFCPASLILSAPREHRPLS